MAKTKFSTATPIRLQDAVCAAFVKAYKDLIEEHGATYAVNQIVADHLRSRGVNVPEVETPRQKIARGQRMRWKSVKRDARWKDDTADESKDVVADLAGMERRRELKRERDRRHRAKKKAEKAAKQEETKS